MQFGVGNGDDFQHRETEKACLRTSRGYQKEKEEVGHTDM